MPSFDIVSRIDLSEVDNAIAAINREIATRFDFKGSKCAVERNEGELRLVADDDLKLKQMHELLKVHLTRLKVEPGALDYQPPQKAAGNAVRQTVTLNVGISTDKAKEIGKFIKELGLKGVSHQIQGDQLRVSGKKRDDLQAAIAAMKDHDFAVPLQFTNFRD